MGNSEIGTGVIVALGFIGIALLYLWGINQPTHQYRIVGTNVTCTGNVNALDMQKQYCGYSFFKPCSDGAKYSCVSVAEVD
jgi:hypothetical protein